MNVALIIFIIIVISLLTVLIYLLTMNKNIKKEIKISSQKNNIEKIDINSIQFPINIEKLNLSILSKACKAIFDSYKVIGYRDKLPSSLDKIEWHTWQVSILLVFLRGKNKIFIFDDKEKLFHSLILSLDAEQINQDMQRIYKKYLENVNIYKNRDDLSKDVIWTARDVSIILYKIINQK